MDFEPVPDESPLVGMMRPELLFVTFETPGLGVTVNEHSGGLGVAAPRTGRTKNAQSPYLKNRPVKIMSHIIPKYGFLTSAFAPHLTSRREMRYNTHLSVWIGLLLRLPER